MLAGENLNPQLHWDLVSTFIGDTLVFDGLEFHKIHTLLPFCVIEKAAIESNVIQVNLTIACNTNLHNKGRVLDNNVDITLNTIAGHTLFEGRGLLEDSNKGWRVARSHLPLKACHRLCRSCGGGGVLNLWREEGSAVTSLLLGLLLLFCSFSVSVVCRLCSELSGLGRGMSPGRAGPCR